MPSYNQSAFIEAAIDSVLGQSHADVELIVGDGGSKDGTLDILADKSRQDPRLSWFSGPDTGPADALNRCFRQAQGVILGWLNSDDLYTEGAIARAVDLLTGDETLALCYGEAEHIDAEGALLERYPTQRPDVGLEAFHRGCFICQPSVFLRFSAYMLLEDLNETYRAAFDFDYWLRAFKAFPGRIGFVDAVQAQSRLHDQCITRKARRTVALEGLRATFEHLGEGSIHWAVSYLEDAPDLSDGDVRAFLEAASPYLTPRQLLETERSWRSARR